MLKPTTSRMSRASKVTGRSVVIACALMRTLRVQAVLLREGFRADDRGGRAAGRRAGHQARQHAGPQHLRLHHLVGRDHRAEHRQRVVRGVPAGLGADLREGLELACRTPSCGPGRRRRSSAAPAADSASTSSSVAASKRSKGLGRSLKTEPSAPGFICSKPSASTHSAAPLRHRLARQEQRRRAGGAVVVDVDDRDAAHAHLVDRALAGGGVAVHVADIGLLHAARSRCRRRPAQRGWPWRPSADRARWPPVW